ncbi:lipase family protein [Microbacterium sp.]|uniref:lipase family protein n=1 Tax=Microbacterium sp. TaxID=51671 RepID=UPI002D1B9E81|nr:lipase family protein [Microbacterium sp.]HWL77386.1 lipase family protein [Microbacterium sp.]
MTAGRRTTRRPFRWSVMPRLLAQAPPRVLVVVGFVLIALGVLIVTRPLTSILLLSLYVGLSIIASGVIELAARRRTSPWWTRVIAVVEIVLGLAAIVWIGRSLDLLPGLLAFVLVIGGLASIGEAISRGLVSQRVLSAVWGGAQIAFGVLALSWPDVTVLAVAVVFGVRTVIYGFGLAVRGARGMLGRGRETTRPDPPGTPGRKRQIWMAVGRYALAVVLVGTVSVGWWLNDWLQDGAPVVDAFYEPPEDVPREHGKLIREDDYRGQVPEGAVVKRILYTTTDVRGIRAVASALVILPEGRSLAPRPVVLWNHGTTGVARGCAPSLRDNAATRWAIPALDDVIERGWAVVAPDYTGQGAPGVFPYLIGKGEAQSALDAVLAANEVEGAWLDDRVVVWGHSQGGHAALWTAQLASEYTPELRIRGTVALAPVGDPLALARELLRGDASPNLAVLTSWVLVPYADTYPDVDLRQYVVPGARTIVREMTQRCPTEPGVIVSVLTAMGVSEDRPLYIGDLTTGVLGRRLEQNAVTGPFEQPVLIVWGSDDEVIPPLLQHRLVNRLCAQGDQVRWAVFHGYDHLSVLQPRSTFLPMLLRWTDDRFGARSGAVSRCPG